MILELTKNTNVLDYKLNKNLINNKMNKYTIQISKRLNLNKLMMINKIKTHKLNFKQISNHSVNLYNLLKSV